MKRKITPQAKIRFLRKLDDRFLELLRVNGDIDPNHTHIHRAALIEMARKKLGFSPKTSSIDVWSGLVAARMRMR